LWRKLLAPSYSPTDLLADLSPLLADPGAGVGGVHLYTFNQVPATEQWRQKLLGELIP
jgi:methylenetetrahydrofolate reductase (NADPH)